MRTVTSDIDGRLRFVALQVVTRRAYEVVIGARTEAQDMAVRHLVRIAADHGYQASRESTHHRWVDPLVEPDVALPAELLGEWRQAGESPLLLVSVADGVKQ